jgi:hypothetical protein
MPWQVTQELGVPDATREEMYFLRVPMSQSVWEFLDTGSGPRLFDLGTFRS